MLSAERIVDYLEGNQEDEYQMKPLALLNHGLSAKRREN
jgi:hypothetical protein